MRFTNSFLIDDVGRERAWPGASLAAEFGVRAPDFDVADYAVRNLGYIAVAVASRFIRVRLRPTLVARPAMATLLTQILTRRPDRVAISWLSDQWQHEVCGGLQPALDRLAQLVAIGADHAIEGRFVATRRSLGTILATPRHPFAPVLHRWLDGACPEDLITFLDQHELADRSAVFERDGTTGDFIFRHSGRGIRIHGAAWPESAIGRRIQDQPDPAYGSWIAETYRAVDDIQVARHELIHATVGAENRHRRRWRYERLLLPWRRPDGGRVLVTISTNVHVAEC